MNEKVLHTLEFDKITERLETLCFSEKAKETARNLTPMTDLADIRKAQKETADALARIYKEGRLSFSGLHDIGASIKRLEVGAALSMAELISISKVLDAALRVKEYAATSEPTGPALTEETDTKTNPEEGDSLTDRLASLAPLSPLSNEIKRCIISEDTMADDASAGLKSVRRQIELTNSRIKEHLASLTNDANAKGYLSSDKVTMRDGRYCLPVKNEHRREIDGMIHDQSGSGNTVFIEPAAVVKYNNELAELFLSEKKEIEKVLAALSNECAENIDNIKYDLSCLTEMDFIFAKAELAKSMKATEPIFNENRIINLKQARHPLIDPKKVVPIDIRLGNEATLLIITGPNTGGKTVSLKTTGLITLMGQSGLHIPAFDKSELGVFTEVFADIGDEQSIEQSLSTFSSHMVNIVNILKKADSRDLILFDELGAGTDPTEGAALAMAILDTLHNRDARVMATTHYSELKIYALTTEGVVNASCEFNVDTLMPTYRLLIGIPGKSNAFAISTKLGLPGYIIEDAKNRIDTNDKRFEDVIADLNRSRAKIEEEEIKIRNRRAEIEKEKAALTADNEKLAEQKANLIADAKAEAARILQSAKDFADESIKKYNKWNEGGATAREMEETRSAIREKLKNAEEGSRRKTKVAEKNKNKVCAKKLHIGDRVLVIDMGVKGTVSTLPDEKGDLTVTMGIIKSKVNVRDLAFVEEKEDVLVEPKKGGGNSGRSINKAMSFHPELNIIGMTTDEGRMEVAKYLDDAYLAHVHECRIIHGRGTGALRNMVHEYLNGCKYVKDYRDGEYTEGGNGATVITMKS